MCLCISAFIEVCGVYNISAFYMGVRICIVYISMYVYNCVHMCVCGVYMGVWA